MPEIAEVALTAEILNKQLKGKKLVSIDFVSGRYTKSDPIGYKKFVSALPLKVRSVNSRGKFMWFDLVDKTTGKHWYIWNTFGLTGIWSLSEVEYTRAMLTFQNTYIYYSDLRNFGTFKFSSDFDELNAKLESLSPDFLKDDDFDISVVKKYNQPIIKILMDQKKLGSGLGNYLAPEILYRAKISPHRSGSSLSDSDIKKLTYWIKYVVKLSYVDNHTGYMTNLAAESAKLKRLDYHPDIKLKNATFKFLVYRQKKDPKGNPVKAEKINGDRTTYWVPNVQK